ncbi:MAG TPA: TonB-dependent receptor [Luteimonas sp.]|nr:TonB-dependent receptor [Luteimonas sp.]
MSGRHRTPRARPAALTVFAGALALCAGALADGAAIAAGPVGQAGVADAAAGGAAAPQATELDRVVVTATRQPDDALLVPAAIDVVDGDALHRARPALSLSEPLQRIPGVVARDRQNEAQGLQVSIRGFGARSTFGIRGVRIYGDGIPATMPDGQGQVSHLLLGAAGRIEVLRGPFSALYGNSSGGVVSVFTADPPPAPEFSAGFDAGSDGLRRASLSWHAPWGGAREGGAPLDGMLLDGMRVDDDGWRDHSASRQTIAQAVLKGGFGDGGRFNLLASTHELRADDPQGLTAAQLDGDRRAASAGALAFDTRKTVRQQQAGGRLSQPLSAHHALELAAYGGHRETTQMQSIPVFVQADPRQGGGAIGLDRDYGGADLRWRWTTQALGRPFSLVAGLEYGVSDERRRGYENFVGDALGVFGALRRDEGNRVDSRDAYLQADWQPADRWRINVGARRSRVRFASDDHYVTAANPDDSGRLDYARTTPVAGVLFRVTPDASVYANAGSGFETPTFSELAYRSDGRGGLNDLRAARSRNAELGVRGRRAGLAYAAALFDNRTTGELVAVSNDGGRSVYANTGTTRRRGVELSLSGAWSPRWRYAAAWTYLDAWYASDFTACGASSCEGGGELLVERGHRIPGLSRQTGWVELRWSANAATDVVLDGRYAGRVYVDDGNDQHAPAYAVAGLGLERRFAALGLHWRGYARIDNLFGREYVGSVIVNDGNGRYFEPAPGRTWVLGLSATKAFDR